MINFKLEGSFFTAYDYDALVLNIALDYQLTTFGSRIKTGFSLKGVETVTNKLKELNLGYMLYFDASRISLPASITLSFNPKDDAYDTYLKFIEKKFQEFDIHSIAEYAKHLSKLQVSNIDTRKVVKVEDYVKLQFDGEDETEIFCIKGAVPIFKPKWNGIRSQSTKNNYTTEYQKTNVTAGEIADNSPLARAILGKAEGENFAFTIDKNKTSGKILQILKRYD